MADAWRLKPPAFHTAPAYEHTFGPQVASICDQVGFAPDPEQRLALNDLFAVTEDGLSAAFEFAVVATRQNLKTGLMKQAAIGWMFVTREEFVTWSAHLFSTTQEAFRDMSALIDNAPILRKRMAAGPTAGVHGARGDQHLELRDGRRLAFRSRTKTAGRGLTGDKIILDEALFLAKEHTGALIPTLTAVPDPQILYGSSAGLASSEILRDIRDRGRAGSPGLAYLEWCSRKRQCAAEGCEHHKPSSPQHEPGCALDDEDLWREANPLLGRRRKNGTGLTLAKMRKFREAEDPGEWMRERLGWWDEQGAAEIFGPGRWPACKADPPAQVRGALALAVTHDLSRATIAAAVLADGRAVVKPLQHGAGTAWVVDRLVALQKQAPVPVVVDGRGPAASLLPRLRKAGVRVHAAKPAEVFDAFDVFFDHVTTGVLSHAGYGELDEAVNSAVVRDSGDRRTWARKGLASDISPLEAVTLADWWASRPKRSAPPPPLPQAVDAAAPQHELAAAGF
jgi:hypothetical protein